MSQASSLEGLSAAPEEVSVSVRNLDLSFGPVDVLRDLNIEIAKGEFLVLLGSSGSGKSTLLNCIAGLLELSDGQIHINGKNVTWAEPSERGIGMVFQSYALYPQMTVRGNLGFGLKNAGLPKAQIAERIARAARVLQIEDLLDRRPAALSGGQRQRVAIGRALVRDVDVFLFDEPLSNLDAKLRAELRVEIKLLHQKLGNTMIYVTHDQVEAMTLADRIAVLKDGKILQLGTPDEVYHRPQNLYVADFIGAPSMNFLPARLAENTLTLAAHAIDISAYERADATTDAQEVVAGIRPEHIKLNGDALACDFQAQVDAQIVEPMGADTLIWAEYADQKIRIRVDGKVKLARGESMTIGFNADDLNLFDKKSENRI
ncbi:MAG: ABC transporter ATP-binding protein [Pseudomonadota bacterium]